MASLNAFVEPDLTHVRHVMIGAYDKLNHGPFNDSDHEKKITVAPAWLESPGTLKMNSVNISNFKNTKHAEIYQIKPVARHGTYSDHPIVRVQDNAITLQTHNLLRYAESFTISMELLKLPDSAGAAKQAMEMKQTTQVHQNIAYLNEDGNKILALQECDYEIFKGIQTGLDDTYSFFCPREVSVKTMRDTGKLIPFSESNPNPYVLSHGTAIFIKMPHSGPITTNQDDLDDAYIKQSLSDANYQHLIHSCKSRQAYILFHDAGIGFISCHYEQYDDHINEYISRIFTKYTSIHTLYVLGDFNRHQSDVISSYTTCNILMSARLDHIIKIERDAFLSAPVRPPSPPAPSSTGTYIPPHLRAALRANDPSQGRLLSRSQGKGMSQGKGQSQSASQGKGRSLSALQANGQSQGKGQSRGKGSLQGQWSRTKYGQGGKKRTKRNGTKRNGTKKNGMKRHGTQKRKRPKKRR